MEDLSTQFRELLKAISAFPEGGTLAEIEARLGPPVPVRRTLQRHLARLVEAGLVTALGQARGRRYLIAPGEVESNSVPLGADAIRVRSQVLRPLTERKPVGYHLDFLREYEPGVSSYLDKKVRRELASVGALEIENQQAGTHLRQLLGRLLIDLSWNSSRLEGNTYSLLETQRLLELGEPGDGKSLIEATMIINHKAAIEMLADPMGEVRVDAHTLCNLHALLADGLLADPAASGRIRRRSVGITGTVFHPLDNPHELEEQFHLLAHKAAAIEDPFELAFFLMVHIPYLQPFEDVNKRVSRLAANIPLMRHNLCPLSFVDVPKADYISGLLGVYELNRTELLADLFVWAYRRSAGRYSAIRQSIGEPDPFRLRYRTAIRSIVQEVVQDGLTKAEAIGRIRARVQEEAQPVDQPRLTELVETELMNLHAGSIARYRLRLSEFEAWSKSW